MSKSLASFTQSLDIVEFSFSLRMYISAPVTANADHETIIENEPEWEN